MGVQFFDFANLLGKSLNDSIVAALLCDLGEPSRTYLFPPSHKGVEFAKHGVGFNIDQSIDEIWSVSFTYDSADVRAGKVEPFSGRLLCGIAQGDDLTAVEQKLQQKPVLVMDVEGKIRRRKYLVQDYLLDCYFDVVTSRLNSALIFSVRLLQKMGLEIGQITNIGSN